MIIYKTDEDIANIRESGKRLSAITAALIAKVKPGVSTGEIDALAERLIREVGGEPSFKGYTSDDTAPPYPSAMCASIDSEVVHAPATPSRVLREGSLFKIDIGLRYNGMCTDMAVTVPVGKVSREALDLAKATREALFIGLDKAKAGNWVSDIGKAVDKFVRRNGYSTVKDLVGHGVGHHVHEDPPIPNFFDDGLDPVQIAPGMALAIEPMVNLGEDEVELLGDGWTVVTADGELSAHFEATVVVTENGTEIVTPIPDIW